MTLALKSSDLVETLISVDNAPVDAALETDFARYIDGMKKVDDAGTTRLADADGILQDYEQVS
jgi:hypothetical protein